MRVLFIVALLSLSGCSLAPFGDQATKAIDTAIDTGIEDRRAYNDKKADTLLTIPCDISIGAFYRIQNTVKQKALNMLCSGLEPEEAPPALIIGTPVQ